ncbi:hypothetical protein [Glutamicibacter sp. V16R2B1]|uniref:hypothetical protein n=1 Tax=Glutamicibacter sp. V16R2B1 TaxID=2036207 RepID=UPI0010FE7640|nr:hypothetical protein [Glutamicibacter sp. V16R2B1]TLK56293.1 hypothetical protein FDN03_02250 [Glutamicibacter sp. V16R2B1]
MWLQPLIARVASVDKQKMIPSASCGGGGGTIILFEAFITTGTVVAVALVLGLAVLAYAGGDRA